MSRINKITVTVASVFAVFVLLSFGAGWFMLDYALKPAADARDMGLRYRRMYGEYPYMRHWVDSLNNAKALRDTFIVMPGGCRHHAVYARGRDARGRTAILVHGYKDSYVGMLPLAKIYADMGYNIMLPDLHAHGLSDGGEIQMGWKDREDVIRWIGVADSLFADSHGRTRIVLHGVSMGAATVMNVSGESLPSSVRCLLRIADTQVCGTSSATSLPTSSACRRSPCFMPPAYCASCATAGRLARRLP